MHFFLPPLYTMLPLITRKNTIVLSSEHSPVHLHAHVHTLTHTISYTHTHLPRKLMLQKGNLILKHLDFSGQETNNS